MAHPEFQSIKGTGTGGRDRHLAVLDDFLQLVQHAGVDKALLPDHAVVLVLAVVGVPHLHHTTASHGSKKQSVMHNPPPPPPPHIPALLPQHHPACRSHRKVAMELGFAPRTLHRNKMACLDFFNK